MNDNFALEIIHFPDDQIAQMKPTRLAKYNIHYSNVFITAGETTSRLPVFLRSFLKAILVLLISLVFVSIATAQDKQAAYRKVVTDRSVKIVNTLGISDSAIYNKVVDVLAEQYVQVNAIHDQSKLSKSDIKSQSGSRDEADAAIKKLEADKSSRLVQRHEQFISQLKGLLNDTQLEKVKDGMTYGVLPLTYASYQEMLLNLTDEQKQVIYSLLTEARELAMDEGSSEDKHKVFGRYKGKINNYLSAAGYDLKKETAAWQQRIKDKRSGNH